MIDRIIEILKQENGVAISLEDILNKMNLTNNIEIEESIKNLNDACSRGIIYHTKRDRYCLLEDSHLLKGKIMLTASLNGFVSVEGIERDIYIDKKNINGAFNEDIVLIEIIKKQENNTGNKSEGRVVQVIERTNKEIIGEIYNENGQYCLQKNGEGKTQADLIIPIKYLNGAVDGHKVKVKLFEKNPNQPSYTGEVIEIIAHKNDVGADILTYVYEYGFSPKFPQEVLDSLEEIPSELTKEVILEKIHEGRIDLREEEIFTIDGSHTKDIDDAISYKVLPNGNHLLGVHIADVSYYVIEDTPLDKEAIQRGTSVYLTDRVLPMLPQKLSNGICSLNPNEDRLAHSCIMEIDQNGRVVDYSLFKSIIKSKIQMTYEKVNEILDKDNVDEAYKPFENTLKEMNELAKILRKSKEKRGYISFESSECEILVDEKGIPYDIERRYQGTGEKLIEDFMIITNETVITALKDNNLPCCYRVHDKPTPEKITTYLNFLSMRGINVNSDIQESITPLAFQKIVNEINEREDARILGKMAIRCQAKAVYSPINIGHFGLGSTGYGHFTSPIRRMPDLLLHRILKEFDYTQDHKNSIKKLLSYGLNIGQTDLNYESQYKNDFTLNINQKITKWESILPELTEHCSKKEQDADDCERDVEAMKKAEYMEQHLGEEYDGMISSITNFGMFVELENTVEGLIKFENLPKNSYHYDPVSQILFGTVNNIKYQIGDPIRVRVLYADKRKSMVDFISAELPKQNDLNKQSTKNNFKRRNNPNNNEHQKHHAQKNNKRNSKSKGSGKKCGKKH